jgi:NAD(P)-dependent dehydrogenase (short-subunit alcohol dehydrogenase family)
MRPTAIITGGSRGLGRALAHQLAEAGWNLVIDARSADQLTGAAVTLDGLGPGTVVAIRGDITDPSHVDELVRAATALGRFSLLVNNAGTLGPAPLPPVADLRPTDLEQTLQVNVVAPLRVIQASLPHLRANDGTIVNVTSDAAVEDYEGWGAYGASKAAFEQLSHILAAEEPVVRVYWVDPGDMRTAMHQAAFPGEDISDRPTPESRVPGIARLIDERPPSGRYRVDDLLPASAAQESTGSVRDDAAAASASPAHTVEVSA